MISSSRLFICLLFFSGFINGARWPWIIKSTFCPLSAQKFVVQSRVTLNKLRTSDRIRYLFPGELALQGLPEQSSLEHARKKRQGTVRVLLAECDIQSSAQWHFASKKGFTLQPINCSDTQQKKTIKVTSFTVTIKRGSLFYKGKRLQNAVQLRPIGGHGEFNGIGYDGDFCIMPHKDSFLCINSVELEDYIAAVLRTESWPGWPLEVADELPLGGRARRAAGDGHRVLRRRRVQLRAQQLRRPPLARCRQRAAPPGLARRCDGGRAVERQAARAA